MNFRIADTFTHSLAKQTGNEQKAAKIKVCDFHMNPAQPGLRQYRLYGVRDPYKVLTAEINREAWETLRSDTSRPFDKPTSGRIAVKVINHLGDEVMKVFRV